ncbi:MAG TPA: sigma factor [Phycisphaerales bacterium]|nr:sigma factor [Phycisphaerales bacterium]
MSTRTAQADATHTHWTLVDRVREGGAGAASALDHLSRFLYPPVLGLIRGMVHDEHTAEDLTQQFFLDVLLWRSLIERADRRQGRLRTVVFQAARNSVRDYWRRERVRAPVRGAASLDRFEASSLRGSEEAIDPAFEAAWLDGLCTEACRCCEEHFIAGGLKGHWTLFERARLFPLLRGTERPARLDEIFAEHGFQSVNQARGAIDTVVKRLRALLLEIAGNASIGDDDRQEQLRALRSRGLDV